MSPEAVTWSPCLELVHANSIGITSVQMRLCKHGKSPLLLL